MHWFVLIVLWLISNLVILDIVQETYKNYSATASFWISAIIFLIWGIYLQEKKQKQKLDEKTIIIENVKKEKQTLLEEYELPFDCLSFKYLSGLNDIKEKNQMHLWVSETDLNLLMIKENVKRYQIPLSDVKFYSIKGDIRQETEITGGNLTASDTMVTEALLGTAAAIKKNQVIQNIRTIDERKTIINAIVDGKNSYIFFEGSDLYNFLLENLPEKEQSFVAMAK